MAKLILEPGQQAPRCDFHTKSGQRCRALAEWRCARCQEVYCSLHVEYGLLTIVTLCMRCHHAIVLEWTEAHAGKKVEATDD